MTSWRWWCQVHQFQIWLRMWDVLDAIREFCCQEWVCVVWNNVWGDLWTKDGHPHEHQDPPYLAVSSFNVVADRCIRLWVNKCIQYVLLSFHGPVRLPLRTSQQDWRYLSSSTVNPSLSSQGDRTMKELERIAPDTYWWDGKLRAPTSVIEGLTWQWYIGWPHQRLIMMTGLV